ncbi:MAG: ribosomal protein S18 acetylase RimI-like enzyme [Alteromonadaceae bacterium]|jgi:ribosomal protein S18 acetylase RimI-like enzyme
MRLSVFSPESSHQLLIDLQKLYQGYLAEQDLSITSLELLINNPQTLFFVTLFNDRHLGAVQITIKENIADLSLLCVRDITRRRGVGRNLLREAEKQLKSKAVEAVQLSLADIKKDEQEGMKKFMTYCGYQLVDFKFSKNL